MGRLVNICGLALLLSIAPVVGLSEASPWSRDYEKKRAQKQGQKDTARYPLKGKILVGGAITAYVPLTNFDDVPFDVSAGYGVGMGITYFVSNRLGLDAQYRRITLLEETGFDNATGSLYYSGLKFAFSPENKQTLLATVGYGSISGKAGTFEFDTHNFMKVTLGSLYQSKSKVWVEFDVGYAVILGKNSGKKSFSRLVENANGLMMELSVGTLF